MNYWHIRLAAQAVRNGGVIACPSEGVFGLACSAWDARAVERLLLLKHRPPAKGLIVVAAFASQLQSLVNFDGLELIDTILASWPGPVTWVLPRRENLPSHLTGRHSGLAVRVTCHPLLGELCNICGPLVSTSANLSGTRPALTTLAVRNYFADQLDYILPGQLGAESGPSEIRDGLSGEILRQAAPKNP